MGSNYYASWLNDVEIVKDPKSADIIIFTGGEDVHPSLYGEKIHPRTYANIKRDEQEKEIFENMSKNQLALGICRGLI